MQNRTVQSLASSELACPPRVTPVVMQLQSEEGRNISLKCRVTGKTNPFIILVLYCLNKTCHFEKTVQFHSFIQKVWCDFPKLKGLMIKGF